MSTLSTSFAAQAWAWYTAHQPSRPPATPASQTTMPSNPALAAVTPAPVAASSPAAAPDPAPVAAIVAPVIHSVAEPVQQLVTPIIAPTAQVATAATSSAAATIPTAVAYHHSAAPAAAAPIVSLLRLMNPAAEAAALSPFAAEVMAGRRSRATTTTQAEKLDASRDDTVTNEPAVTDIALTRSRAEVIAQAAYKVVARVGDRHADVLTLLKA